MGGPRPGDEARIQLRDKRLRDLLRLAGRYGVAIFGGYARPIYNNAGVGLDNPQAVVNQVRNDPVPPRRDPLSLRRPEIEYIGPEERIYHPSTTKRY